MCLAVPGKLISVSGEESLRRTGRVSFGGVIKEVSLACVPEAVPGNYVLVHVGLAISVIDEEEASQVWKCLEQIDALEGIEYDGEKVQDN